MLSHPYSAILSNHPCSATHTQQYSSIHPCSAIHTQQYSSIHPCLAIPSTPIHTQPYAAIPSHTQPYPDIPSYTQPYPAVFSYPIHTQPYPAILIHAQPSHPYSAIHIYSSTMLSHPHPWLIHPHSCSSMPHQFSSMPHPCHYSASQKVIFGAFPVSWCSRAFKVQDVVRKLDAPRMPDGAPCMFGPLYVARLCKSLTHVVSPYSGGVAECVLGCNLWNAYAVRNNLLI
ncbi:hypothetical protein AB205_0145600 [Aquarana catesbeiana]|uniref:Uncharacterized protein n=1 Tax=Aquarana catesbeiana TaxID=8400 RepID=A0A2G9RYQ3_AQUCT|nr:hypothetical protein AB205_0145600 [Aquarana catesbeiana]